MQSLRDIPKYEAIRARLRRYPDVDAAPVETFLILLRLAGDALAAVEVYLARQGLSHGRLTVMTVLNRDPQSPFSPSDLADQCGVSRATMTGLIDGLVADKLVKRDQHPADRRKMQVRLTPDGAQFLDSVMPQYCRRIVRLMGHLTEPERATLEEMLAKINAGVGGLSLP